MISDIKTKQEGILTWHRDSFGVLTQRLFVCLMMLSGFWIF